MYLVSFKEHFDYLWFILTSILFYCEELMIVRGSECGCDQFQGKVREVCVSM